MKYDFVSLNGLPAVISWLNAHPQWTVISVNNDDGSWWILYSEQAPSKEQRIMKDLIDALEKISNMKLENGETDYKYAFNRCWHLAVNALEKNPIFKQR